MPLRTCRTNAGRWQAPVLCAVGLVSAASACRPRRSAGAATDASAEAGVGLSAAHASSAEAGVGLSAAHASPVPRAPRWMHANKLQNKIAYIPSQCFTMTRAEPGQPAHNPCYVCHTRSTPPNFADDADLQLTLSLPVPGARNPWTNLFDPPIRRAPHESDDAILAYVRRSNYFDDDGGIALARALAKLPAEWDGDDDGRWGGFVPDVWFRFDDRGFDHRPDGALTGWRAFAYYPFPGTFFPTNGSMDDVLIRLDPVLQQDASGRFDRQIYEINLAIAEALATRSSVPIDPVDERALGVDLDLDGRLGQATRVAFDAGADGGTKMRYVGRAHATEAQGAWAIAPGLLPLGTELFHTVRYLDVGPDGTVTMAPRMKEVRYAKKIEWESYERLAALARGDALEQEQSPDGTRDIVWAREKGIYNGEGWALQGFIEAADGSLRPQSFDETAYCVGCHGGIGATTDSMFSFARKLSSGEAHGWFHWSQHDLRGLPEPKLSGGAYEYTTYLEQAGAGDELRENAEVLQRFFDDQLTLRAPAVARLHDDVSLLLLPSVARALDLDRAYQATVAEQSFWRGRESVIAPGRHVYTTAPRGESTGIQRAVDARRIAR